MPENEAGHFNEAMMDLGSEICRPKNPKCGICPLNKECLAFDLGKIHEFPVKSKKAKATNLELTYYYVECDGKFLIKRRGDDFIWKRLYEFPTEVPAEFKTEIVHHKTILHKLTHKNLTVNIYRVILHKEEIFKKFAEENGFVIIDLEESHQKSFPKPLENYLKWIENEI